MLHWLKTSHGIFLIFSPSNIPVIGDTIAASVASQVNELNQKIDGLTQTKANKQKLAGFIRAHAPANHLLRNAKPLTYAVVLKNCPNLSLPEQRKEFVDSLCPIAPKDIEQLERSDKEWKAVVRSKNAANSNAESVKQS